MEIKLLGIYVQHSVQGLHCGINDWKQGNTTVQPTEQTVLYVYHTIHENGVLDWDTDEELVLKVSIKGGPVNWGPKNSQKCRRILSNSAEKKNETIFQVIKSR